MGPFAGVVGVPQRVMTVEELALQRFQGAEATRAARATYAARAAFNQAARGAGFTPVEIEIMYEAQAILGSREINAIRAAHESGEPVVVNINGRAIQYEPNLQESGLSMVGENGFHVGRGAFASEAEFERTVLHELHRLYTSTSANGVSGELAAVETAAAYNFAERSYTFLHGGKK